MGNIPVLRLVDAEDLRSAATGTGDCHLTLGSASDRFLDLAGSVALKALGDVTAAKTTIAGHRLCGVPVGAEAAFDFSMQVCDLHRFTSSLDYATFDFS
jgi:hypothetical protein